MICYGEAIGIDSLIHEAGIRCNWAAETKRSIYSKASRLRTHSGFIDISAQKCNIGTCSGLRELSGYNESCDSSGVQTRYIPNATWIGKCAITCWMRKVGYASAYIIIFNDLIDTGISAIGYIDNIGDKVSKLKTGSNYCFTDRSIIEIHLCLNSITATYYLSSLVYTIISI